MCDIILYMLSHNYNKRLILSAWRFRHNTASYFIFAQPTKVIPKEDKAGSSAGILCSKPQTSGVMQTVPVLFYETSALLELKTCIFAKLTTWWVTEQLAGLQFP